MSVGGSNVSDIALVSSSMGLGSSQGPGSLCPGCALWLGEMVLVMFCTRQWQGETLSTGDVAELMVVSVSQVGGN